MSLGDKIKNKAQEVSGSIKEAVGEATDDKELQAEGQGEKAESGIRQGVENVKDAVKNVKDGFTK